MEICKLHQMVGGSMNPVMRITEEVMKAAHFFNLTLSLPARRTL